MDKLSVLVYVNPAVALQDTELFTRIQPHAYWGDPGPKKAGSVRP